MSYYPDKFVVLEFNIRGDIFHKVFAGWYGGYGGGDSWKLNSGITTTLLENDIFTFYGYSGSTYICNKCIYGMSSYMHLILKNWLDNISIEQSITILSLEDVLYKLT